MRHVTVKALTNLGTNDYPECPLQEGETAVVTEGVAARLVANRHGVIVDLPPAEAAVEAAEPSEDEPSGDDPAEEKQPAKPPKKKGRS